MEMAITADALLPGPGVCPLPDEGRAVPHPERKGTEECNQPDSGRGPEMNHTAFITGWE